MSDLNDNLVLEHLRHIRAVVDETRQDVRNLKLRLGTQETQRAGVTQEMSGLVAKFAHLSTRFDRVDARLERIEHRLIGT